MRNKYTGRRRRAVLFLFAVLFAYLLLEIWFEEVMQQVTGQTAGVFLEWAWDHRYAAYPTIAVLLFLVMLFWGESIVRYFAGPTENQRRITSELRELEAQITGMVIERHFRPMLDAPTEADQEILFNTMPVPADIFPQVLAHSRTSVLARKNLRYMVPVFDQESVNGKTDKQKCRELQVWLQKIVNNLEDQWGITEKFTPLFSQTPDSQIAAGL